MGHSATTTSERPILRAKGGGVERRTECRRISNSLWQLAEPKTRGGKENIQSQRERRTNTLPTFHPTLASFCTLQEAAVIR